MPGVRRSKKPIILSLVARRPPLAALSPMPPPSPHARPCLPPVRRVPPCALPQAHRGRGLPSSLSRRGAVDDPRSAWALLGDGRPAGGHGPAADAAVRGLGRGGPSSPLARLRVELARPAAAGLARLRLAPTLFEVGTRREDRRGSSRRSAALSWPPAAAQPCGHRVGARAEMRYAAARRESNPASDPRSGYRPRLRASFKSAEDGGFSSPLVRPRLSRPFFGLISALWGLKMPPAPAFHPKNGLKRRCKAACNSPRVSRYA